MKKTLLFMLLAAISANAGVIKFSAKNAAKGSKIVAKSAKKAGKAAIKVAY